MNPKKIQALSVSTTRFQDDPLVSPSEMTPELVHFVKSSDNKALKLYESYFSEFYSEGVTYTRQTLLKSVTEEWQMHHGMPFEETYKIINTVARILLLNEVEIIYWSLLLKVKCVGLKPVFYAYFTAYQAKSSLNTDTYPFEICLNSIIPNFRVHFNNWQLVQDFPIEVTPKSMNNRLLELTEMYCKGVKDYELMVKQLMQVPRRKESQMSESHASELELTDIVHQQSEEYLKDLLEEAEMSPIDKQ